MVKVERKGERGMEDWGMLQRSKQDEEEGKRREEMQEEEEEELEREKGTREFEVGKRMVVDRMEEEV